MSHFPRFCKTCRNILPTINIENISTTCIYCHTQNTLPENDRIITEIHYNSEQRKIRPREIMALAGLETTAKTDAKICPNCGWNIMNEIYDTEYNFSFVCLKCFEIYQN